MPTDPPRRVSPGRPRASDYPIRLGPVRLPQDLWDMMERVLTEGIYATQRDLVEAALRRECVDVLAATVNGGTTNGTEHPVDG